MPAKKIDPTLRPNIFHYHDHISFLRDWFLYLKKSDGSFSMRRLAEKIQIAVGYLPMCLSGKRVLSTKSLQKIVPHIKLYGAEKRFLELLHIVGTAEEPQARLQAVQDMGRLQPYRQNNLREVEVYRYLTKWHYVAIREMTLLKNFKADPQWIQERLSGRVSLAECEEALGFLIEKGFILVDVSGRHLLPEVNLDCKEGIYKVSLGEFHRQMFQLAAQSIERVPRSHRCTLGHTLAVNSRDLPKVREILAEAQAKLEKLGQETQEPDHVYHVELASFPLTEVKDDTERDL